MKKSWSILGLAAAVLFGAGRAEAAAPSLLVCSGSSVYNFDATSGAFLGIFASGGGLTSCYGEAFGPDGNLYVADFGSGNILKFSGQTGAYISVFANAGADAAYFPVFGPDGNLYVGNNSNLLPRFNGTTGAAMGTFITGPSGAVFGGMTFHNGSAFVSWIGNGSLYQYNATTGAQVAELYAGFAQSNGPHAPVFGPDGNLYVPDWQSPNVAKFNGTTFAFLGNIISDSAMYPSSLVFGPDGNILVLNDNSSADTVRRYNAQTGAFLSTVVAAGSGGLGRATQILIAPSGAAISAPALGGFAPWLGVLLALTGLGALRARSRRPLLA